MSVDNICVLGAKRYQCAILLVLKKGKYKIQNEITIERKILLQMIQGIKWQHVIYNIILAFENLLPAKSQISLTGKG